MKKVKLLLFISGFFFLSCKKENSFSTQSQASKNQISKLKDWFESKKSTGGLYSKDSLDIPEQLPVWDSTIYHADGSVYTTPIQKGDITDPNFLRSLVIHVDEHGNVIDGEYTFIRLENVPGNLTAQEVLASYPKVFNFQDMPDNFKASMLKYDLNGHIFFAKRFQNQVITETSERLQYTERAPINSQGNVVCEHIYWVTYYELTGVIISITYLGTECTSVASGGGGAPAGSCSMTTTQATEWLNAQTALPSTNKHLTVNVNLSGPAINGKIRNGIAKNWEFLNLSVFGYTAHFSGVAWKFQGAVGARWESLKLDAVSPTNQEINCTHSTVNSANITQPIFSQQTGYNGNKATFSLEYSITLQVTCVVNSSVRTFVDQINDIELKVFEA